MMIALLQAKVDIVLKYFWEFTLKILPKKNNLSSVITYLFVFVLFSLFALFRNPKTLGQETLFDENEDEDENEGRGMMKSTANT